MLTGDDLTVQTFIAATAIALLGIAVTQAGWTHKHFVRSLFIVGCLLAAVALLWSPIIHFWPAASNLSIGPWAWLLLVTLAVGAISWLEIAAREKRRASVPLNELRREIDRLTAQVSKVAQGQGEANSGLSGMIGRVEDKADKIALNVQADIKGIHESIRDLGQQIEKSHVLTGQGQMRLRNAFLARNAHEMIKQQDAKAVDLAERLISGAGYETHTWLTQYREWKDALSVIDTVIREWQKNRADLLDVRANEIEHVRDTPPSNLDRERTTTQFKTLCIVNERYQNSRTEILDYFAMKAADL